VPVLLLQRRQLERNNKGAGVDGRDIIPLGIPRIKDSSFRGGWPHDEFAQESAKCQKIEKAGDRGGEGKDLSRAGLEDVIPNTKRVTCPAFVGNKIRVRWTLFPIYGIMSSIVPASKGFAECRTAFEG